MDLTTTNNDKLFTLIRHNCTNLLSHALASSANHGNKRTVAAATSTGIQQHHFSNVASNSDGGGNNVGASEKQPKSSFMSTVSSLFQQHPVRHQYGNGGLVPLNEPANVFSQNGDTDGSPPIFSSISSGLHLNSDNDPAEVLSPHDEQISELYVQQLLQNSKKFDPDAMLFFTSNYSELTEPLRTDQQEHIIQSHSESARNALIYIAVILLIYLMAIVFIAVQYYRKHSTLDPLTAFILRRSSRSSRSKDAQHRNRKRRRYSNSNSSYGTESVKSSMMPTSSSTVIRNSGSDCHIYDGPSPTGSSTVKFDPLATVYGENGSTCQMPTATSSASSERKHPSQHRTSLDSQVVVHINVEPEEDEEIDVEDEEDNEDDFDNEGVDGEYYGDEEYEDEEMDSTNEVMHEDLEMAVLPSHPNTSGNPSRPASRGQRLRALFTSHFGSGNNEGKSNANNHRQLRHQLSTGSNSTSQYDNHHHTAGSSNTNGRPNFTRSTSLQTTSNMPITDVFSSSNAAIESGVDNNAETEFGSNGTTTITNASANWRANDVDVLKFKRSSIAGFTVAASAGPLGLFKSPIKQQYEETHL